MTLEIDNPFLSDDEFVSSSATRYNRQVQRVERTERLCKMRSSGFVFEEQVRAVYSGSRLDSRVFGEHVGRCRELQCRRVCSVTPIARYRAHSVGQRRAVSAIIPPSLLFPALPRSHTGCSGNLICTRDISFLSIEIRHMALLRTSGFMEII